MASSEHPFPNLIPFRHPLPSGFKLTPDARSTTLPVTPVIPPTVANGDVITSLHENLTVAALGDLWTNEQWLAAQSLSDPTSAKGDLLARDASALARLAVGTAGQVLTVDAAAPLGVKWAAPAGAVLSVFGRTGVVVATAGDYTAALVTNAVSVLGSYADPAWITSLAYAKITGAPAAGVPTSRQVIAGAGLTGGGALTADVTLSAPLMGPSGASHKAGIVPDPGATVGAARYLREDATWAIPAGAGGGLTDPTTTLGDLIVRGAAAPTRLGVGTNGQALVADSAAPLGVKWGTVAAGGGAQTPWTSDINAANFNLNRVQGIGIGALQDAAANFGVFISHASIFDAFKQINSSSTGWAGFSLQNDLGSLFAFRVYGSGRTPSDVAALESSIPMTFFTGAVERMRIATAGNVGIGTSNTGSGRLCIEAATDRVLAVRGDPASFALPAGLLGPILQGVNSAQSAVTPITLFAQTINLMGGNVGVGKTNPAYVLDVVGDCNITGTYRVNGVPLALGQMQTPWLSDINGGGFKLTNVSRIESSPLILSSPTYVAIQTGSTPVEWVRVTSTGSVGIGSAAPLAPLTVKSDDGSPTATQVHLHNPGGGTNGAGISFQCSYELATSYAPKAGIVFERGGPNGTGPLKFFLRTSADASGFVAADERMRISAAGNVGIGTTSPGSRLSVAGLPTSSAGLTAGDIWIDVAGGRVLKIV